VVLKVTFYGVRGSFPCPSPATARYGGNTASVCVERRGAPPILLDMGTGVHRLAADHPESPFVAAALVTHLHLDHVQGLPFFAPMQRSSTQLDVYAPKRTEGSLAGAFADLVREPYCPFTLDDLPAVLRFHEVIDDDFELWGATVKARPVPHAGSTLGYRIEWDGTVVAYVSDHQAPEGLSTVADEVLELCDGADLLIHEAQYTSDELELKWSWGHCTPGYALHVAREAGVHRLSLFHHDPSRSDDELDRMVRELRGAADRSGIELSAAAEGQAMVL